MVYNRQMVCVEQLILTCSRTETKRTPGVTQCQRYQQMLDSHGICYCFPGILDLTTDAVNPDI